MANTIKHKQRGESQAPKRPTVAGYHAFRTPIVALMATCVKMIDTRTQNKSKEIHLSNM
jgi:hypothetical protein